MRDDGERNGAGQESIGFLIGQAYRKISHVLTMRFKPFDITLEQFAVLFRLHEDDGITQKELAERSGKDQPTTTRILDCLERKGMIRRQPKTDDRRAYSIYMTEEGRRIAAQLLPIEKETLEQLTEGIPEEQMVLFRQMLTIIQTRGVMLEGTDREQQR
ncbi:MarR family winged helix-turn-helix transcriptional regulator [Paenibacillus sp. MSJ-34]|nr:MarR family transcriptional regulator [Paenibacillus sp. MSJ-34]MBU5441531.1 MarR family transcriptional regulator [Paenibacillus sp. MSJ-34]CAH0117803.1 Transcriptional regulator SlyA [Paenibacillus sp. CECT 9249]